MAAKKPKMRVGDLVHWTGSRRFKDPENYILEVLKEPRWEEQQWLMTCKVVNLPIDFPENFKVESGDSFGCACFSVFGRVDEAEFNGNI